ncbi:MAG TPA: NmrA family NAD(P)-binding protein [Streptosporangiaceae bacterium]
MTAAARPGPGGGRGPERLAILGATGGIGGHLLSWAVDAGYPVRVLARPAW